MKLGGLGSDTPCKTPEGKRSLDHDKTAPTSASNVSDIPVPETSLDEKAFAYHLSEEAMVIATGLEKRLLAQPIDRTTVNYQQDLKSLARARKIQRKIEVYDEKSSRYLLNKAEKYKIICKELVPREYRRGRSLGVLVTTSSEPPVGLRELSKSITSLEQTTETNVDPFEFASLAHKHTRPPPQIGQLFRHRIVVGQQKAQEFKKWRNGWKGESGDRIRCDGTGGDISDFLQGGEYSGQVPIWPTNYQISLPDSLPDKSPRSKPQAENTRVADDPTIVNDIEVIELEGESPELRNSQEYLPQIPANQKSTVPVIDLQSVLDESKHHHQKRHHKHNILHDKYFPTASVIEEVDEAATGFFNNSIDARSKQARKRSGESSSTLKQSLEDYQLKYKESKSPKRITPSMKQTPRLEISRGIAAKEYVKGWKQPR